jgi:elongation factor G
MADTATLGVERSMPAETDMTRIRNLGVIAHIDAGKTTTTERILYYSRRIHKIGNVDDGNTTTDWYALEQKRGISIFSAAISCSWKGFQVNLIDTPGHVDFTAEVERSLRVLDGAVIVFDAVNGVEAQSETVWRQADRYGIPRLVYINKMDRPGAHYDRALVSIARKLGGLAVPVTIPLGCEAEFAGVIDVIRQRALRFEGEEGETVSEGEIPEPLRAQAQAYRDRLLERVAEYNDEATERYLAGEAVTEEVLVRAIRAGTLACRIFPAYCGSSLHNQGVQPVLDGVLQFLPSPLDRPVIEGRDPDKTDRIVKRDLRTDRGLCALAFKTETDRYGELTYVRVYSGRFRTGDSVYNPRVDRGERATRLFRMFSHDREPLDAAGPGEIVAVLGLRSTVTGDTLCDRKYPVVLGRMQFPEPVVTIAIEPKSNADRDKLEEALRRLAKDDPTFRTTTDPETGQTLMHCMGELHAEVLLYRLDTDFNVKANTGEPRVAYKEMLQRAANGEGRCQKQLGGRSHYGHVVVRVEPHTGQAPVTIETQLPPNLIPREFVPAVLDGLKTAATIGPLAACPLVYTRVVLIGGSTHPTDASEVGYMQAAELAFQDAAAKAGSVILEPVMKFEVVVPESFLGDVLNDLNRRKAAIDEVEGDASSRAIRGIVPIAQMFGYASTLRSLTQGRGAFSIEPHDYRPVDEAVRKRICGEG